MSKQKTPSAVETLENIIVKRDDAARTVDMLEAELARLETISTTPGHDLPLELLVQARRDRDDCKAKLEAARELYDSVNAHVQREAATAYPLAVREVMAQNRAKYGDKAKALDLAIVAGIQELRRLCHERDAIHKEALEAIKALPRHGAPPMINAQSTGLPSVQASLYHISMALQGQERSFEMHYPKGE